jgi:DNA mismatch repair protein MutL
VRFRRAAAVADSVREAVRAALASAGYARAVEAVYETVSRARDDAAGAPEWRSNEGSSFDSNAQPSQLTIAGDAETGSARRSSLSEITQEIIPPSRQGSIEFGFTPPEDEGSSTKEWKQPLPSKADTARGLDAILRQAQSASDAPEPDSETAGTILAFKQEATKTSVPITVGENQAYTPARSESALPPLVSAANLVREVPLESISANIRPLGQLDESFIIATDDEGLLLIDQHVAHERILFDKYLALEGARNAESQNLLMPETFDLTPAQAATFDSVASELEAYGFGLMRLSGRTVAIKAVPADLPAGEARNMLAEVLETVDAEKRGSARATLRDEIAASLACRAAIKINTPLAAEKMRWLIDRLLLTSSPTTCPHGRPVILRLTTRDIEKGFHRT